ncbi:MAG: hypothetical protein ACRET2_09970 [Steroidobacteraceae bacterium]
MSPAAPSALDRKPVLPGRLVRELAILVGALAFGVLVVPPLLALALPHGLGPYAGGGMGALVANFFRGLAAGSFGFWAVVVIPYLVTLVVRILAALVRLRPMAD